MGGGVDGPERKVITSKGRNLFGGDNAVQSDSHCL